MAARLNIQRTGDGGVEQLQLKPGNNKLRVVPGRTFNLQDPDGQPIDPSQLRVLQVDNDLIIENIPVEGSTETASVTLEGYYQVCSATDRCTVSVGGEDAAVAQGAEGQENLGTTENSQTTVLADVSTKPLGALSDGTFVLYDTGFQAPEQPATEEFPIRPVLYGAGGLAVVALAAGGGGGGGDPSGAPNLGDVPLALKSATSFNNRFPTISGTAKPGTVVTLRLDTDNDQRENVTYSATADANGNWSVNLQSAKPATGNLPATGLSDSNTLEVSGALDGVQGAALPVVTLTYDNTPPASAEIAAVSGDNIITAAEKTAGVAVSGTAEANGTVELKIGGTTKLVAVDAEGKWNTTLSAAELPAADGQHTLTATAIDAAGNRGPAATSSVTLHTNSKAPVIGIIASDDIINAAEAAAGVKLQGSAEAGSKVELTFGTNKVAATADANGHWHRRRQVHADGCRDLAGRRHSLGHPRLHRGQDRSGQGHQHQAGRWRQRHHRCRGTGRRSLHRQRRSRLQGLGDLERPHPHRHRRQQRQLGRAVRALRTAQARRRCHRQQHLPGDGDGRCRQHQRGR